MSGPRLSFRLFPLILAACAQPAGQPAAVAIDSAAVSAAATNFWQRYSQAVVANDTVAMLALMDDSIRVDARGMPALIGKAALQAQFSSIWKNTRYTALTVTPDLTIPASSDQVYQNGSFVETTSSGGKDMTEFGRYASAIVRGADGQWRLGYIMAFGDSTVPAKK
jgi:ketosteroid isomerase-like protein